MSLVLIFAKKDIMIKSMTGFGKASCQLPDKNINIEVRALNGKNLDIGLKVPQLYKEKEQEIRSLLSSSLSRGKIELFINIDNHNVSGAFTLNKPLIEKYYRELSDFVHEIGAPVSEDLIPAILRLPEVFQQEDRTPDESEWEALLEAMQQAIQQTDGFRISEGAHLETDLRERIVSISKLLAEIDPLEADRTLNMREKLNKALETFKEDNSYDSNRFEQELIYYLEKLDITEEKVRLHKHLEYFSDTLANEASSGKKLGFITQEIGREINTIGSKANDAGIQRIVVQMKDELEKIKEQLMNIL
jgi:uncharacterized protein (TIGR00255 family)